MFDDYWYEKVTDYYGCPIDEGDIVVFSDLAITKRPGRWMVMAIDEKGIVWLEGIDEHDYVKALPEELIVVMG